MEMILKSIWFTFLKGQMIENLTANHNTDISHRKIKEINVMILAEISRALKFLPTMIRDI